MGDVFDAHDLFIFLHIHTRRQLTPLGRLTVFTLIDVSFISYNHQIENHSTFLDLYCSIKLLFVYLNC